MSDQQSLIRARYANSVLRVAMRSSREEAIKLAEGLANDLVNIESDERIANARADTRKACDQLASALKANSPTLSTAWKRAVHAAELWLETVH
jgi:hypothetical protein